ncbi:MAG: NAD(P)-binding domain-containing protein [Nibricoccus sp.]
MKIGILGAGGIGQAYARHFAAAGYRVVLSNSRGPESLADVVCKIGPNAEAGTVADAAAAEVVFLAITWPHLPTVLGRLVPWNNRIVIDSTNAILPGFVFADLGGRTSSEVVASLVPGARLVKAGNTLPTAVAEEDPRRNGGNRVIFLSGDHAEANALVAEIFARSGFAPVDLGGLIAGGRLQQYPGGTLAGLNLFKID